METIKITYDGKEKEVYLDDFVNQSKRMLDDFGLVSDKEHILSQIRFIQKNAPVDVIGVFLSDYIVK